MSLEVYKMKDNTPPEYTEVFTYAKSLRKAAESNLDVVIPEPNQLFIDIDNEEDFRQYAFNVTLLNLHLPDFIVDVEIKVSKSGGLGRHITVTVDKYLTDIERIGLQAMLGSDRKREMLSWLSAGQGHEHPTLFFEKKPEQLNAAPEPKGLLGTTEELQMSCDSDLLSDKDIPF